MQITISDLAPTQDKSPPQEEELDHLVFGTRLTNRMFMMDWERGEGWSNARIVPYQPLVLDPSAIIFHYGQEAFEGLKAYHTQDGRKVLFRPRQNFERLNRTAERLYLPTVNLEEAMQGLKELVRLEKAWIPSRFGTSLYIRPTLIGTEAALGLKPSGKFLFFIIMCTVGSYYKNGFKPVKILVEEKYIRAAPGGVGDAKTAGNYAASNLAENQAKAQGFDQVLWLDAIERRYAEEVGSMNIFFVIHGKVVTPSLTGTILQGVTRDSVICLARHWGLEVEERRVSLDEVVEGLKTGTVSEVFGSGTAAVISPVGELHYRGQKHIVGNGQIGPIAQRFFDGITGIQYGQAPDPFGWLESVE